MVRGLQPPDFPPRAASEGDGGGDNLTTLAPGARVGKYEMHAVLGQGAFGITYRARDMQLDREVA
ncbi:MAG TPA: hypothetical protein VJ890_04710, partial [Vineibacter sp.]|nr:hypothetical protein [Vineibacter sp.]